MRLWYGYGPEGTVWAEDRKWAAQRALSQTPRMQVLEEWSYGSQCFAIARRSAPVRTNDRLVLCSQCCDPISDLYLKISAGIWCQNCDDP